MKKGRYAAVAAANLLVIGFVVYAILAAYFGTAKGNMDGSGPVIFRYYTMDSNILAGLFSIPMAFFALRALCTGRSFPAWAHTLRWVATTCIMITFLVVVVFLSSLYGLANMNSNENLYLHTVTPLLCLVSFLFLEQGPISFRGYGWTLLPTAVYGVLYYIMVVGTAIWPDFYGFNMGGKWYISVILMAISTCVLSLVLWLLRKAFTPKH